MGKLLHHRVCYIPTVTQQWGVTGPGSHQQTYYFPIAFANSCYVVGGASSYGSAYGLAVISYDNTKANIGTGNSSFYGSFYIIALGY